MSDLLLNFLTIMSDWEEECQSPAADINSLPGYRSSRHARGGMLLIIIG